MLGSTTDPAAPDAAKKDSVETSFTVWDCLASPFGSSAPAARSAAEAVREVLREGVISHSRGVECLPSTRRLR